ncbi:hypothetical protein [Aquibacillus rhizosphaerae]|uniref:Uncharacterized protein n=1 Tax=Aquibacillus rhizosphaerae TaxID=3051431 RepID=A0ABT7L7Q3_9BACI|nr:hypothetical protein [Aquibacillus sp. LR5S19]MDL4841892.1 hypothetical protein [Aquibacillus sp. LR5S19]
MIKKTLIKLIGFSIVAFLLSGCFGEKSISLPIGEEGESVSIGGDEEEGFTLETENKDGESISLSSSKELPEEFPSEVPFPTEYQIVSTVKVNDDGQEGITVSYLTESMSADNVWEMYKSFMSEAGFESSSEMTTDAYNSISMHRDEESLIINVISNEDSTVTSTITYVKKTSNE